MVIILEYTANIVLRFGIRRNALIFLDAAGPGIVCRQSKLKIGIKHFQQLMQLTRAGGNILPSVEHIAYTKRCSSVRHQLHQALSAGSRYGMLIKTRFDRNKRLHTLNFELILLRVLNDQRLLIPRRLAGMWITSEHRCGSPYDSKQALLIMIQAFVRVPDIPLLTAKYIILGQTMTTA